MIETKSPFSPDQIHILFFLCLNSVLWKNSWVFKLHCIKVRSPGKYNFSGCMNRDKYMLLFRSVLNMKFCVISYFHAFFWRVMEEGGVRVRASKLFSFHFHVNLYGNRSRFVSTWAFALRRFFFHYHKYLMCIYWLFFLSIFILLSFRRHRYKVWK